MADVFTKRERSEVMSRIRSRGNQDTEPALARLLRRNKITGWRRQIEVRMVERETRSSSRGNEAQTENRQAASGKAKTPHPVPLPIRTPRPSRARRGRPIRASSRRLLRAQVDFVFPKLRLAIFVDGCFWHACPIHATKPKNNAAFWLEKLAGNRHRDARVTRTLRRAGWRVLRLWEHELARKNELKLLRRIQKAVRQENG